MEILKKKPINLPLIIGGEEITTETQIEIRSPHDHSLILGNASQATKKHVSDAIKSALSTKLEWMEYSWDERAAIFLKAAELLAGSYRIKMNAATMLNLSKNPHQAEIDSACELIDFLRFNTYFMYKIYGEQPNSPKSQFNRLEYRPLDGFVFAVTPFNFVSIMGNLPSAPAIMGNVVLWKPASSVIYVAYKLMKLFQEAGLPDGVINFIPGRGSIVGDTILENPNLGGIHFTGSTETFDHLWQKVGENIKNYNQYPRLVGETGGKDFIIMHRSADIKSTVTAIIQGGFEYQGQKCSAVSRVYIPKSDWKEVRDKLVNSLKDIKIGPPDEFSNFINAVIDRKSFLKIQEYLEITRQSVDAQIVFGGNTDDSKGYFIEPTIILSKEPDFKTMVDEIFGPIVTIYLYEDNKFEETLRLIDNTSKYALTGSVFASDRKAIADATKILRYSAGNFYINSKPTGAAVNMQPFGGSRKSGTNDKAGSFLNLLRWVSTRTIKEEFLPPQDYSYPFLTRD